MVVRIVLAVVLHLLVADMVAVLKVVTELQIKLRIRQVATNMVQVVPKLQVVKKAEEMTALAVKPAVLAMAAVRQPTAAKVVGTAAGEI